MGQPEALDAKQTLLNFALLSGTCACNYNAILDLKEKEKTLPRPFPLLRAWLN